MHIVGLAHGTWELLMCWQGKDNAGVKKETIGQFTVNSMNNTKIKVH